MNKLVEEIWHVGPGSCIEVPFMPPVKPEFLSEDAEVAPAFMIEKHIYQRDPIQAWVQKDGTILRKYIYKEMIYA